MPTVNLELECRTMVADQSERGFENVNQPIAVK